MRRKVPGLQQTVRDTPQLLRGSYLVRIMKAQYYAALRPYLKVTLSIIEPAEYCGIHVAGRIDCTPKSLWKLSWFLRDFGYDTHLLYEDEIDEESMMGLEGVIKVSRLSNRQTQLPKLEAFAPAYSWKSSGIPSVMNQNQELAS